MEEIGALCPQNILTQSPVEQSHILKVLSAPPVAKYVARG